MGIRSRVSIILKNLLFATGEIPTMYKKYGMDFFQNIREGCKSPSPKVVCTLYRHTANDSQGMCTVCTLSLVVATILVNSGGHLYTFLLFCLIFLY